VFDSVEREIKYLVLTNTWPKFVNYKCVDCPLEREQREEHWEMWKRKLLCAV
ncbi:hypothetical protein BCR34DRAFT_499415, partial [Clohesyomyces aquaticus]